MMLRIVTLLVTILLLPGQTPDKEAIAAFSKQMESAPADQRLAYNVLQVSFATFSDAHLRHETCLSVPSGMTCKPMETAERAGLDREFVSLTVQGDVLVLPGQQDLEYLDSQLNRSFQNIFEGLPADCSVAVTTCLSQPTFRDVERDWIRYRDAWAVFGTLHWPKTTETLWKVRLTILRLDQLKALSATKP